MGVVIVDCNEVGTDETINVTGVLCPTTVAISDVASWKVHSETQLLEFGTPAYLQGYDQFIQHRLVVEQATFGISESAAALTARWLAISAQRHDEAEHLFDTEGQSAMDRVRALWLQVREALEIRYLIKNVALVGERISVSIESLGEMTTLVELQVWVKRHLQVQAEELIKRSRTEAETEAAQWQVHHERSYGKFLEVTKKLLILYGHPEDIAIKGAGLLAAACQQHDELEDRRDRGGMITESEMHLLWKNAVVYMTQYYALIMLINEGSTE